MAAQIDRKNDPYSDKIVKLLPAEGTAALLAIENLIPNQSDADIWMVIAIVAIAVFVVLWALAIRKIKDPLQLSFLTIGYLIWAINVTAGRFDFYFSQALGSYWFPFVPAMIAILYSLFIPLVFRK